MLPDTSKMLIVIVIAVLLIGPSRLTEVAAWLGRTVRQLRDLLETAKQRARAELGEDFDDIPWQSLDPRRYDPRKIIADAMLNDPSEERIRNPGPQPATPLPKPRQQDDLSSRTP